MRKASLPLIAALALSCLPVAARAEPTRGATLRLDVRSPSYIVRDEDGVPYLFASNEHDLLYLQGYVHARDRLFQMDLLRRQADGTLAELLGIQALPSDVQLRTFGIRRAAERSLAALAPPTRAGLAAYAAGVNAYISTQALPREYRGLEITRLRPWAEADSVAIAKLLAFQMSFELGDLQATLALRGYQAAGAAGGFDGTSLFLEDIVRYAPFDPAATLPDAMHTAAARSEPPERPARRWPGRASTPAVASDTATRLARDYLARLDAARFARGAVSWQGEDRGGSQFVVAGRLSATGRPLIAGAPHLPLGAPSSLYNLGLEAPRAGIDAVGATLPGVPYILFGNNNDVSWTLTTSSLDVTDVYEERVTHDATSPSGFSTIYQGRREHVVPLPQTFRVNAPANDVDDDMAVARPGEEVPAAVLIVPRRNHGPILASDVANGTALSVQYAGFSATRELDALRGLTRARNLDEFAHALQGFDAASQNVAYADVAGNIAFFTSGELPLREDLEAGEVAGVPPLFMRNGEGGNEWLAAAAPDPSRALPYEILPWSEMPGVVNPPRGFIVNASNDVTGAALDNDPLDERRPGGGIRYLSAGYAAGVRAGRITELLAQRAARGRLTTRDLEEIHADTVMGDARYFAPFILAAWERARAGGAHPMLAAMAGDTRVAEAIARLAAWDHSTPTGIRAGYDAGDRPGHLAEPDAAEIARSVAATIYSVWRSQFLRQTIDATLRRVGVAAYDPAGRAAMPRRLLSAARNLLDTFDARQGIGTSGVDFFWVPQIADAGAARDLVILRSLRDALDSLAGAGYAAAFAHSTHQDDYRWGLLHRVALDHPLGATVPELDTPAGGSVYAPAPGTVLPGIPVDGGTQSVDGGSDELLVDSPEAFVVRLGAAQRYVARVRPLGRGFEAWTALPGGQSGVPGDRFHANLLERWLTNESHPLRQRRAELVFGYASVETVLPAKDR